MRVLLAVLTVLVAGCAMPIPTTQDSGVEGTVWLGPTCPVQRDPPDPNCADRPTATSLVAVDSAGSVAATFASNATGWFHVSLAPGNYTLRSPDNQTLPRCASDGAIQVKASRFTQANVTCDSGIR